MIKNNKRYFYTIEEFNKENKIKHNASRYYSHINHVQISKKTKRVPINANLDYTIREIENDFDHILLIEDIQVILMIEARSCPIQHFLYEDNTKNYLRADLIDFLKKNYQPFY